MIYLYIKKHKITGMQYLGKTSALDPHKYTGSGKYWKRHLKKHGLLYDTEILLMSQDETDIKETGQFFSTLFNVVISNDWANLKIEEGDGGWSSINKNKDTYIDVYRKNGKILGKLNKNTVAVVDKNGKKFRVTKDDQRLKSGELVGHTINKMAAYDKEGNMHHININDQRLKSGELQSNNAGKVYITNGTQRKLIHATANIPTGWYLGDNRIKYNKGKIWITDGILSKMVFPDNIPFGWKKGRTLNK